MSKIVEALEASMKPKRGRPVNAAPKKKGVLSYRNRKFSELPFIEQNKFMVRKRNDTLQLWEKEYLKDEASQLACMKATNAKVYTIALDEHKAYEERLATTIAKTAMLNFGIAGPRPGAGFLTKGGQYSPPVVIDPKGSAKKLEQLGFDPIDGLIKLSKEIDGEILYIKQLPKPPMQALAVLYGNKQKIMADLLRYGYARQTETTEVLNGELEPMKITLDFSDSGFSIHPSANEAKLEKDMLKEEEIRNSNGFGEDEY